MKKKVLLSLGIISLLISSSGNLSAQEKGSFIIDPYYGFPNFGKSISTSLAQGSEVQVRGIGPWGLRMEYMIADQFGLTLDGIHNSFSLNETYTPSYVTNDEGNQVQNDTPYDYKASMNRLRIQVGCNYHFGFTGDSFDFYVGGGVGTNMRFYNYETNEPNSDYVAENESEVTTLIPVSFRLRSGIRYYFTDMFGLNAEVGIGGPVLSGGLSFKF